MEAAVDGGYLGQKSWPGLWHMERFIDQRSELFPIIGASRPDGSS